MTRALLAKRGLVVLGSRGPVGETHPAVYLAATRPVWEQTAAWFDAHPTPRKLVAFALADAVVRTDIATEGDEPADRAWEATLHPDLDASTQAARVSVADREVAAFEAAVTGVGGSVARDHRRVGTLTYVPVQLPNLAAAEQLRTYQQLRSLRPIARVSWR